MGTGGMCGEVRFCVYSSSPPVLFSQLSCSTGTQLPGPCPSPFRVATTELSSWSVVLGSLKQEELSLGAEEVPVAALQLPKAYNHYSQGSDLALLQLSHPTAHTTLCLPRSTHHFPFGASCWATGWDQNTSNVSRTLRNLRLRLISRPTCNCLYNRLHQRLLASPARPGMLCGGAQHGVQGPCQV